MYYREKSVFKCCLSAYIIIKCWVAEIVRQRVPGHRADNGKRPTTKLDVV